MDEVQTGYDEAAAYAEKQEVLVALRRKLLACMETGNTDQARTLMVELKEFDFMAYNRMRAEIVRAYGTDI
ncbi:hypothetical protein X534_gp30 [Ralstonia phage RSB3]|uniref:Uncharacterized protein n=1 Tax=Ralstonia phage RSB3 TaxID=1402875 RepID=U3TIY5_9CAUD|nr:hypothetical protein X534_gp30 [Ralstonia phage RSB3]BAN92341.1 hypothetical protein [Ralstonia phage RSB3]